MLTRRAFGDHGVSFLRGDVEKVTGHPAGAYEAPAREWIEILHPADRESVLERLDALPALERTRLEYRVRTPEGGVRWIREDLRVMRKGYGSPPEVVGVLTDVTFERTAQGRLSRVETELWRSRKMESVGKIAAEVAHDFNNLLTVILASCDLLRHDPELPDEAEEETRVIRESAVRGRDLVRRILSFAARLPGGRSALDISETVAELEEILARVLGDDVTLETEIEDGEGWPVMADRTHVEQVLLNLVNNAGEAMEGGGRLTISIRNRELEEEVPVEGGRLSPGRWVELTVKDTGTGISEEARERVFEPFFSTKAERKGAGGFGLATVLRIVQGSGGGIRIETEPGRGTAFHLYFPVREEEGALSADLQPLESDVDADVAGEQGLRILVLDDDEDVRSVIERILVRRGHTVATVGTAAEALQVFDRVRPPFELLVADIMLPDHSGPDVHRALRRRLGRLPVVFMSAYGRDQAVREGMVEEESPFLEKPFAPGELVRVVDRIRSRLRDRADGHGPDLPSAGEAGG